MAILFRTQPVLNQPPKEIIDICRPHIAQIEPCITLVFFIKKNVSSLVRTLSPLGYSLTPEYFCCLRKGKASDRLIFWAFEDPSETNSELAFILRGLQSSQVNFQDWRVG